MKRKGISEPKFIKDLRCYEIEKTDTAKQWMLEKENDSTEEAEIMIEITIPDPRTVEWSPHEVKVWIEYKELMDIINDQVDEHYNENA